MNTSPAEGFHGQEPCGQCNERPGRPMQICPAIGPSYEGDYISMLCDCCEQCERACVARTAVEAKRDTA